MPPLVKVTVRRGVGPAGRDGHRRRVIDRLAYYRRGCGGGHRSRSGGLVADVHGELSLGRLVPRGVTAVSGEDVLGPVGRERGRAGGACLDRTPRSHAPESCRRGRRPSLLSGTAEHKSVAAAVKSTVPVANMLSSMVA